MGAGGSTLSVLSPKGEDNIHFYDAFLKMKLEKMSDNEIYNALKKKYVHGRKPRTGRAMRNNSSLQSVALIHFSQTLETNRIVFEKKKNSISDLEAPLRSNSYELFSAIELERVPFTASLPAAKSKPKKIASLEINIDVANSNSGGGSPPPQQVVAVKPSKRPQLRVSIDPEIECDDKGQDIQPHQDSDDGEQIRTPRVEGRISPSGAVHVGRFAINEKGLRSEMTGRESPHAFLTAGKSDFVEIGFLGSGATSSIIEALHIPTLTIVALKMLPAKDTSDLHCISSELSVLYQNLAELRLIDARLDEEENSDDEERSRDGHQATCSPCQQVLALYDAFLDPKNGMVNLVVEYMDGGSLQDLVDRGGCQDEQVLADITHQGLLGLDFLHGQNCIHRDIKPGNILVNCAGVVKLADFGVAKAMDINFEMNMEASFVGTMCYMAPERMMSKTYGVAADIWSFGLTLLAVVLGRYPLLKSHEKSNYWDLMRVICDETPPEIDKKFSKDLRSLIDSCLQKNPDERSLVKALLRHPFVSDLDLPINSRSGFEHHTPLSAFTVQGQVRNGDPNSLDGSDAMLVKFAHLETVLEKTEVKYQYMVELWKKQGNLGFTTGNDESSYRSISARSISMKSPAEPMTRLPNFVSGLEQWKHLATQLHLPLDMVLTTASTIINRKYFAKL